MASRNSSKNCLIRNILPFCSTLKESYCKLFCFLLYTRVFYFGHTSSFILRLVLSTGQSHKISISSSVRQFFLHVSRGDPSFWNSSPTCISLHMNNFSKWYMFRCSTFHWFSVSFCCQCFSCSLKRLKQFYWISLFVFFVFFESIVLATYNLALESNSIWLSSQYITFSHVLLFNNRCYFA